MMTVTSRRNAEAQDCLALGALIAGDQSAKSLEQPREGSLARLPAVKGGVPANLSYHDLSGLSLLGRNMSDANFTGTTLYEANLRNAWGGRAILFRAGFAVRRSV